jgi:acyl dehydratase
VNEPIVRRFAITEARVRAYSRRGNYHSEPETARAMGLPGLVAQGVQVAGPAYGALLDAWGDEFLAHGEIELRFVGVVLAGDDIEARVELARGDDGEAATLSVENLSRSRTAVVGEARRRADA